MSKTGKMQRKVKSWRRRLKSLKLIMSKWWI